MTVQRRPRLLDLCCGAGGASVGYERAGFDVVGVDIEPQPFYPFEFHQADALRYPLSGFDVVVASPPCQRWSAATPAHRRNEWPDLLAPLRARLRSAGVPYVIENVPGAPLDRPVWLCGSAFGLGVRRHRGFESNVRLAGTQCAHFGRYERCYGASGSGRVRQVAAAMGVAWMPWSALIEAVPPDYSQYLGRQLMRHVVDVLSSHSPAGCVTPLRSLRQGAGAVMQGVPAGSVASPAPLRLCACGRGLPLPPSTGRWPVYCSSACRQRAYRLRRASS